MSRAGNCSSYSAPIMCARLPSFLVACFLILLPMSDSYAQQLPPQFRSPSMSAKLENFYRNRLVEIVVSGKKVDGTALEDVHGVGFVISPQGEVITAGHVIERATKPTEYAVKVTIYLHEDKFHVDPMDVATDTYKISNHADIGRLKIKSDGAQQFDYMCTDKSAAHLSPNDAVTIVTSTFLGGDDKQVNFQLLPGRRIDHSEGPADMYKYIGVNLQFQKSNSGGAVVREFDNKVIGVISKSLTQADGKEIPDESYANLLWDASDILDDTTQCDPYYPDYPDNVKINPLGSQKDFMSGTCEGTIAWKRDGGEYWVFPDSGKNYVLEREDMRSLDVSVCGTAGDARRRSLHFTINHSTSHGCKSVDNFCSLPITSETFYGVQIVPVFKQGTEGNVATQVWLQKSNVLFARTASGAFYTPTDRGMPNAQTAPGFAPQDFDDAIKIAGEASATRENNSCGRNLGADECLDLQAMKNFSDHLDLKRPWHGFARRDSKSQSTILAGGKEIWRVPEPWLDAGKNQVLNWILRYRGTNDAQSPSPVDFSFCVFPQWTEFYLQIFSPERCVNTQIIHVYIKD